MNTNYDSDNSSDLNNSTDSGDVNNSTDSGDVSDSGDVNNSSDSGDLTNSSDSGNVNNSSDSGDLLYSLNYSDNTSEKKCGYFVHLNPTGKLTNYDKIIMFLALILLVVYTTLVILYPYASSASNNPNDIEKQKQDPNIRAKQYSISIVGFLLGTTITTIISDYILREYNPHYIALLLTTIISSIIIIFYYTSSYIENKTNVSLYINHLILPLFGSLAFIGQYSISKTFQWIIKHYSKK
jgi:magnesium-transporting ATPase (P-type)